MDFQLVVGRGCSDRARTARGSKWFYTRRVKPARSEVSCGGRECKAAGHM